MIVLGIDPGTLRMGYGVIENRQDTPVLIACGVLLAPRRLPLGQRLVLLYEQLQEVLSRYTPDQVAVEEPFIARNVRSAMAIGEARAIAILAACIKELPVASYSPAQVKSSVSDYGRSDKRQVQEAVRLLLGLAKPPEPYDASDALAIAICHLRHSRLSKLLP